jgi:diacylglycerol kinase family enzyme
MLDGATAQITVLAVTLVLAVGLYPAVRVARRRRAPARRAHGEAAARGETSRPRAGIVVNHSKVDTDDQRLAQVAKAMADLGWDPPLWYATTIEDPGPGQTKAALAAGCDAVLAFGGDGTARMVADQLLHTGVPLGLLPAGTGNLLARNLRISTASLDQALVAAVSGEGRTVDVGRAEVDVSGEDEALTRQTFLVMAGLGFDAEVMATVNPQLKQRVGWWAYVLSGVRVLRGRRTKVRLALDGEPPVSVRVRSVVVGNCGELTGGIRLLPEAQMDDGWLDVVVVSPRGMVGWAGVVGTVLTHRSQARGVRRSTTVQHFRCRRVEVRAERPLFVQLDGDPAGSARVLRAWVDPRALVVNAPPRAGA